MNCLATTTLELSQTFSAVLIGFSFVFFVLLVLTGLTYLLKFLPNPSLVSKVAERSAPDLPAASHPEPGQATDTPDEQTLDPRILAAISAAIQYSVGRRAFRMVAIRSATAGWAHEGRRQIFASRNPR
ncbi:MAG: OadG family protein [Puniceicoccaceae bacterium]